MKGNSVTLKPLILHANKLTIIKKKIQGAEISSRIASLYLKRSDIVATLCLRRQK